MSEPAEPVRTRSPVRLWAARLGALIAAAGAIVGILAALGIVHPPVKVATVPSVVRQDDVTAEQRLRALGFDVVVERL